MQTELANCRGKDPDLFFPERGEWNHYAKELCSACPIRQDCLEVALSARERFGVWGGLSEQERLKIRRKRRRESRSS